MNPRLEELVDRYSTEVIEQAEINLKYESYIEKEKALVEKIESLEDFKIPSHVVYDSITALSAEAREKLNSIQPETIGQASRISGVSPADISIIMVYLGK